MVRIVVVALLSAVTWGTAQAGELPRKAWTAAQVSATRWSDTDLVSVDLAPGVEVEVVAELGDKVRVRSKTSFGWVAADQITDQAPVAADSVNLSLDGAPGFR